MEKVLVQVADYISKFSDPTKAQVFYKGGEIVELPLLNSTVENCIKDGRLKVIDSNQIEVLKKIQLAKVNPEILEERQRYEQGMEELRELKEQMQNLRLENKQLKNTIAKNEVKKIKASKKQKPKKED